MKLSIQIVIPILILQLKSFNCHVLQFMVKRNEAVVLGFSLLRQPRFILYL